ncbi:hypothetical protein L211DRAFT_115750 [Terfezia boudieri ATCC MYA-4762]|uniref:RRM domain-containing protein n=1 Tax=Terfezia boudieri ATCC MYA-4762 TaxID=1051890 RepID=A0A3N4LR10_9PEZI|nr:hypothetical protein L211DRAFT_115750 [Terfezia boudieri ATCC MYA-4762]
MASAGSVFMTSPKTKTINTPPHDAHRESKPYYSSLSPPQFRLSPSETTSETWGSSMTSRSPHNAQVPDWEHESAFYKHSDAPPGLRDTASGFYNAHLEQPVQKSNMEALERGFLNLNVHRSTPLLSPLPPPLPAPILPPQVPRRYTVEPGNTVDNPRQLRPPVDTFASQALLPITRPESSPSPATYSTDWSDTPTRHLIINGPENLNVAALKQLLKNIGNLRKFDSTKRGHEEFCIASFYDLRAAQKAHDTLRLDQSCGVKFCSHALIASLLGFRSEHEGQVLCQVSTGANASIANIDSRLYQLMSEYGPVSSFTSVDSNREPSFLVRFYDVRHAEQVVAQLDGQYVESFYLRVELYEPQPANWSRPPPLYYPRKEDSLTEYHLDRIIYSPKPLRLSNHKLRPDSTGSLQRYSPSYSPTYSPLDSNFEKGLRQYISETRASPSLYPLRSPFSRPTSISQGVKWDREADDYSEMLRLRPRDPREHRGAQYKHWTMDQSSPRRNDSYHTGLNKNTVDLERIAQGLDTRTTVMLRNIPNKVDQPALKDFLDSTSRGKYDFLYLRIDFKNMCNVGYAFINFIDPMDIIAFVVAKSGKRWNKYNSDKVLDVTYANIQGTDQLVEKFRNSSVMDQPDAYRPKLYHSSGPLAGQEAAFPESNNPNRKLRSITAAQHIGLFAPKINTNGKVWRKRD